MSLPAPPLATYPNSAVSWPREDCTMPPRWQTRDTFSVTQQLFDRLCHSCGRFIDTTPLSVTRSIRAQWSNCFLIVVNGHWRISTVMSPPQPLPSSRPCYPAPQYAPPLCVVGGGVCAVAQWSVHVGRHLFVTLWSILLKKFLSDFNKIWQDAWLLKRESQVCI